MATVDPAAAQILSAADHVTGMVKLVTGPIDRLLRLYAPAIRITQWVRAVRARMRRISQYIRGKRPALHVLGPTQWLGDAHTGRGPPALICDIARLHHQLARRIRRLAGFFVAFRTSAQGGDRPCSMY
jgi:hypothetical protein